MEPKAEKLTYEEFRDLIYTEYVSEKVVSTAYMNENSFFVNSLALDAHRLYLRSSTDVKIFGKMIESFFHLLFKLKGSNENIEEDDIYLLNT